MFFWMVFRKTKWSFTFNRHKRISSANEKDSYHENKFEGVFEFKTVVWKRRRLYGQNRVRSVSACCTVPLGRARGGARPASSWCCASHFSTFRCWGLMSSDVRSRVHVDTRTGAERAGVRAVTLVRVGLHQKWQESLRIKFWMRAKPRGRTSGEIAELSCCSDSWHYAWLSGNYVCILTSNKGYIRPWRHLTSFEKYDIKKFPNCSNARKPTYLQL